MIDYFVRVDILILLYAILAGALNLVSGYTGLVSLAQAAFYGLGAYTSALLVTQVGAPFLIGLLVGMAVAVLASLIISLPSARLDDDYIVIATFGFQMILVGIFNNWVELTGGPLGIPGIPQPTILGWHVDSDAEFLVLTAGFTLLAYFVVWRITRRSVW